MPFRPRRRSPFLAVLLLVLALVAAACGDDGGGGATSTTQGGPTTSDGSAEDEPADDGTGDTDGAAEGVTRRDAGLDLPRSTTYAGVELAVTAATWSNAQPSTFGRPDPVQGTTELLYLDLTTRFVDGFPGTDSLMPASAFAIETADGTRVAARGVDFLDEVPVSATADSQALLAFELDEADLDGATLVYDDGTRLAAYLPFAGRVPASPYPIRVEVGTTIQPQLPTGCEPAPADVTLAAVEWDVDAGVGLDGAKLAQGRSSRVSVGHRWLRAELEVTAIAGQCGGTFANFETFRVLADGQVITPVNAASYTLADGQRQPMSFLFEVPADADAVVLEAGRTSDATATIDLDVPALPDPADAG